MSEHAMALKCAASDCLAVFAVRRASQIAGLRTSDASGNVAINAVELKVGHQKNDQLGVGQGPTLLPCRRGGVRVQFS